MPAHWIRAEWICQTSRFCQVYSSAPCLNLRLKELLAALKRANCWTKPDTSLFSFSVFGSDGKCDHCSAFYSTDDFCLCNICSKKSCFFFLNNLRTKIRDKEILLRDMCKLTHSQELIAHHELLVLGGFIFIWFRSSSGLMENQLQWCINWRLPGLYSNKLQKLEDALMDTGEIGVRDGRAKGFKTWSHWEQAKNGPGSQISNS